MEFGTSWTYMHGEGSKWALKPLCNLIPIIIVNTMVANWLKSMSPRSSAKYVWSKNARKESWTLSHLPCKKISQLMLIELIYHIVLWLNTLPKTLGLLTMLSPWKMVLCHKLDFKKHCKAPLGTYYCNCKAHNKPTPSNTMTSCTIPAIILGPIGNIQGM